MHKSYTYVEHATQLKEEKELKKRSTIVLQWNFFLLCTTVNKLHKVKLKLLQTKSILRISSIQIMTILVIHTCTYIPELLLNSLNP